MRVPVASTIATESMDLSVTDGTSTVLRRIYWQVEAAVARKTEPYRVPTFTPSPQPFVRVLVDFLSSGSSRITWELDRAFAESGPYVFQLQYSQVGSDTADDWTNVGVAVQDATYLIDPDKRLWAISSTTHYRVVLTTASATHTSPPTNIYGLLNREQWLTVREVFRKEQLMLRRFTGTKGYLLKAKRYGPVCSCVSAMSYEIENSACPLCYGTGITGGYQTAIPFTFVDQGNESFKERVAYNENLGTIGDAVIIKGRVLAVLPIVHRDVVVLEGSDRRYYIHRVATISSRLGVPIVYDVELRYAPRSDVVYTFDIVRPDDDPPYWCQTEVIAV